MRCTAPKVRSLSLAFLSAAAAASCGGPGGTAGGPASAPAAAPDAAPAVVARPTWTEHIAPLVARHCTGCHRPDGIAPFSLTSYATARVMAPAMVAAVKAGRMPPSCAHDTA
jgi:hypothetical protein